MWIKWEWTPGALLLGFAFDREARVLYLYFLVAAIGVGRK